MIALSRKKKLRARREEKSSGGETKSVREIECDMYVRGNIYFV